MSDDIIYNIPVSLASAYQGRHVIIRSNNAAKLAACLAELDTDNLEYVQLTSLEADDDALVNCRNGPPVELVMLHPEEEFSLLYRYIPLLAQQPVQVSIPVVPGFSKAVRLALSLHFAVKLEIGQPDTSLVNELLGVLQHYLHNPTVTQPLEFFHSMLMVFFHGGSETLWEIQEEHPDFFHIVADNGAETICRRLVEGRFAMAPDLPHEKSRVADLLTREDCRFCEFRVNCCGYFKWPRQEYDCEGIKTILSALRDAATALKGDISSYNERGAA